MRVEVAVVSTTTLGPVIRGTIMKLGKGDMLEEVSKHKVPTAFVCNFDQTGMHVVPVGGGRTYAAKSSKQISLTGPDDKRQITGVPLIFADGEIGPMQLIFRGTIERSIRDVHPTLEQQGFEGW
ncbi:hypothetical protein WJX74_007943 [Apatococcus lobatus]|uniref:Uncharacterized protein n=1 Tax=Apatococcus lobatus TaxID=904363 RepID=A0AAW1QTI7_9CHLO